MNTVINYASGKLAMLCAVIVMCTIEFTTAPPNRGHDAQNAVGYNCDNIRPSMFNCDWEPPRIFLHIRYKLTPNESPITH